MGIAVIIGDSSADRLFSEGVFPRCGVVCVAGSALVDHHSAALILSGSCTVKIRSAAALIINADSPEDIPALGGGSITVITCGRAGCNTVSISSITEERVTLSLNRSLQTLSGICEPLEQSFPLIADIPLYDYMAGFAACIVLGLIS